MNDNPRWRGALHEAGHAAAALVLRGDVDAVCIGDDRGVCNCKGPTATDDAFIAAAGPAAERLLSHIEAPVVEPTSEIPKSQPIEFFGRNVEASFLLGGESPSDDQRIARWAIAGLESEPSRWAGRVHWAHSEAEAIIRHNAGLVLAIARELFNRGVLSRQDIQTLTREAA